MFSIDDLFNNDFISVINNKSKSKTIKVLLINIEDTYNHNIVKYNNIEFHYNLNPDIYIDFDYYIILNNCDYEFIKDKKNKVILLHGEPWIYDENKQWGVHTWGYWSNPTDILHLHNHKNYLNLGMHFKNKIAYDETNFFKTLNKISTIQSNKYVDEGHIKRIDFIQYLYNKNDIPLHIYGNNDILKNNCPKSYIKSLDNIDFGYRPYKYYFMGENNYEHNYITEKLFEPIIYECLTFYFGPQNIYDHLHPMSFVLLDPNDFEKSYLIVKQAIEENWYDKRLKYIQSEKKRITNLYTLYPTIELITNYYQLFSHIKPNSKIQKNKYVVIFIDNNLNSNYINGIELINNITTTNIYKNIYINIDIITFDKNIYNKLNTYSIVNKHYIDINTNNFSSNNEYPYYLLYNFCRFHMSNYMDILYISQLDLIKQDNILNIETFIINHLYNINNHNMDIKHFDKLYGKLFITNTKYFSKLNITNDIDDIFIY